MMFANVKDGPDHAAELRRMLEVPAWAKSMNADCPGFLRRLADFAESKKTIRLDTADAPLVDGWVKDF